MWSRVAMKGVTRFCAIVAGARSPVAAPVVGAAHAGTGGAMGSLIQRMRAALGADDADGDADDDREAAYAQD